MRGESTSPSWGHTRGGSGTGAPISTVPPALVQFTLVACVTGLAAALGLPPCIEETATTIEALQGAGSRPRGCEKNSSGQRSGTQGQASQILGYPRRSVHTIRRGCWRGHGHTGAIIQSLSIGTGTHRPTGAQETQPLTLLAVTGVGHCGCVEGVDTEQGLS